MKNNKILLILLVGFLFFIILDSGGVLGLRNLALLIFLFFLFKSIFLFKRINLTLLGVCFLSFSIFIYCVLVALHNGIIFSSMMNKIAVFLLLPFFILSLLNVKVDILRKGFIYSGFLFSLIILMSFGFFLINSFSAELFFKKLGIPGWFYLRSDGYPQVYFQATLTLVPIAIFSYYYRFKKISYLILLTLLISLSRFGLFLGILFVILLKIFSIKKLAYYCFLFFILISFSFPLVCYILYSNLDVTRLYSAYANQEGFFIRLAHLYSIYNNFDVESFIFGKGAGSFYYTIGFHEYVDNIEISQLEALRRNGIIGYYLINLLLAMMSWYMIKSKAYIEFICLFSFYIVAFSNPVLFSMSLGVISAFLINHKSSLGGKSDHINYSNL